MDKLLFIDDEEGIRRSVVRALKQEPYNTHTAENGETGIAFVKENISDTTTVISDYKMPGLDGIETLAIIGSINPEITRIVLTGYLLQNKLKYQWDTKGQGYFSQHYGQHL